MKAKATTEAKAEPKTDTKPAAEAVPEKYDLKAPEGYEIDPKLVEEATPIFKELGLSQDAAQKLTDLWNKHSLEAAQAPYKAYEDLRQTWRSEVIKDSSIGDGKEGLRPETKAAVAKAMDAIGDPKIVADFKAAMDLTGAGDNPAFIRALATIGKVLSEGTPVRGGSPSPEGQRAPGSQPRSAAAALYPNLPTSSGS